jgi:hypothetical protein
MNTKNALRTVRLEWPANEFSSATGDGWIEGVKLEGYGSIAPIKIYCNFVPNTSHFVTFNDGNYVPPGSELIDLTTGDTWRMSESNTWDAVVT